MEAPPSSEPVNVFDLLVAAMGTLFEFGSYRKVLLSINMGVKERAEREHNNPEEFGTNHPNTVEGKPALPSSKECFIVRVTSTEGQRVCFLFEWSTLYNVAFYPETEVEAQRCWYIYSDYAKTIVLPPATQFIYAPQRDVGFHVLKKITGTYSTLGKKEIRVGRGPFNGYIRLLFTIRTRLQEGNKLVMREPLRLELQQGALSFAPVVISEASRFGQYKYWMIQALSIDLEQVVPKRFADLFTLWSALSWAIRLGKGYTLREEVEHLVLINEQVQSMVCILCKSIYM